MINRIKLTDKADLMALVDGEKNILEGIDISDLFVNSDKRINWKCENKHFGAVV